MFHQDAQIYPFFDIPEHFRADLLFFRLIGFVYFTKNILIKLVILEFSKLVGGQEQNR